MLVKKWFQRNTAIANNDPVSKGLQLRWLVAALLIGSLATMAISKSQAAVANPNDYDGDGIANSADHDDDNDGILDSAENPSAAASFAGRSGEAIFTGRGGRSVEKINLNEFQLISVASSGSAGLYSPNTAAGKLDFSKNQRIVFDINPGRGVSGNLVFLLFSDTRSGSALTGPAGPGGGAWGSVRNGLAFEFDTYRNRGTIADPAEDHFAVWDTDTGTPSAADAPTSPAMTTVYGPVALKNLPPEQWRRFALAWDATTKTLSFNLGGVDLGTFSHDIVKNYFNNDSSVRVGFSASNGSSNNVYQIRWVDQADSDGDGIRNSLDLDSDNDSIPDLFESGISSKILGLLDTDNDGQIDSSQSVGSDGYADALDRNNGRGALVPNFTLADSDGDTLRDAIDLDSDNDGITDLRESGLSIINRRDFDGDGNGTIADVADANDDGIFADIQNRDGQPISFEVPDTDNDGVYDFRDLDSDNDAIPDLIESGAADTIKLDTNKDGRISSSESPMGFDGVANGAQSNLDGNGLTQPVSSDEKNEDRFLADFRDLDSDNDGIVDIIEAGGTDADFDGVVDGAINSSGLAQSGLRYSPTNSSNDGVADYRTVDSNGSGTGDDNDSNSDIATRRLDSAANNGILDRIQDSDQDGVADVRDGLPGHGVLRLADVDHDGDGIFFNRDLDDDNDGLLDFGENLAGIRSSILDSNGRRVFFYNFSGTQIFSRALGSANRLTHNEIQLTPKQSAQTGIVHSSAFKLNLSTDQIVSFDVFLGDEEGGGDGIAFLLHNDTSSPNRLIGSGGADLGAKGIRDGLAFEFDTFRDSAGNDITADHFSVWQSRDGAEVVAPVALPNLEDGKWRRFTLVWDVSEKRMTFSLAGQNLGTLNKDVVTDYFNGASQVFMAFSGATRASGNDQRVRWVNLADADNDGIINSLDLDADNDAIPDLYEGGAPASTLASIDADKNGQVDSKQSFGADGFADALDINGGRVGGSPALKFSPPNFDADSAISALDLDSDNDGISDLAESGLSAALQTRLDPDGNGRIDQPNAVGRDGILNGLQASDGGALTFTVADTDGDGLFDYRDLDSDNDSIPDLIESGHANGATLDSNNNAIIDGNESPTGTDGIVNRLQGNVDGGKLPAAANSDATVEEGSIPDFRDLDSDNDGLFDLIEAGGADSNNNALADASVNTITGLTTSGVRYTPTNSTGSGLANYRLVDSNGTASGDDNDNNAIIRARKLDSAPNDGVLDSKADSDGDGIVNTRDGRRGFGAVQQQGGIKADLGAGRSRLIVAEPGLGLDSRNTASSFVVSLQSQPASNVVVNVASSDSGEVSASPASLTFTPANWNQAQTVSLKGVADNFEDASQNVSVNLSVNSAASDDFYDGLTATVPVLVANSDPARITAKLSSTTLSENNGSTILTLTRSQSDLSIASRTRVNLGFGVGSDRGRLDFTEQHTFAKGEATITRVIRATDNALAEGDQKVTLEVGAQRATTFTNFFSFDLTIVDDETPTLDVKVAADSLSENKATTTLTVSRNTPTTSALTVNLSSSDTSEATVPATLVIAAGQASGSATLTTVDDTVRDGIQRVTVAATARGFEAGTDSINVVDDDNKFLSITLSESVISEQGGQSTATITRHNVDNSKALEVKLTSSDTTEAAVPATVTIAAGQTTVTAVVRGVNDDLDDGDKTAMITATATGLEKGEASLRITDDDVDTDRDGIRDAVDLDDDNDGILDSDELPTGVSPLLASSNGNELFTHLLGTGAATNQVGGKALFINPNELQLTVHRAGVSGIAHANATIDMSKDQRISFDINLGNDDINGGDGIAFIMHADTRSLPTLIGQAGPGHAAWGIRNGLAFEFDTFKNAGTIADPDGDHFAVWDTDTGTPTSAANPSSPAMTTVLAPVALEELEDGKWRRFSLEWDASETTMRFKLGDKDLGTLKKDVVKDYFGNSRNITLAFSGSTGSKDNDQRIRWTTVADPDGDNLPNTRDLDADSDGIADLVESGYSKTDIAAVDANKDGQIDSSQTFGADGFADRLDKNSGAADKTAEAKVAAVDSDSDGYKDFIDLDSDNDAISDLAESSVSAAMQILLDGNRDGRIDSNIVATGALLSAGLKRSSTGELIAAAVDTDGDGVYDFRDLDADNDSIPDLVESGISAAATADKNTNGRLENSESSVNSNGLASAALNQSAVIAPANSDTRSEQGSIADFRDLDSDNDGLSDIIEAGGVDANGNALTDARVNSATGLAESGVRHSPTKRSGATLPNYRTVDSNGSASGDDNDSVAAISSRQLDSDPNDGVIDDFRDSDGDGLADVVDGSQGRGAAAAAQLVIVESAGSTTINESGSGNTDSFTVALSRSPASDVNVNVASADASKVAVSTALLRFTTSNWQTPQTVTVTGMSDNVVTANQRIAVTASVAPSVADRSFFGVSRVVNVSLANVDTAKLASRVGSRISENGGSTALVISRNAALDKPLQVSLTSSDTSEAMVPASVTIAAGSTQVAVRVAGVNDSISDGDQQVTITAAASGFASTSSQLTVTDDDVAKLELSLSATSIAENGGKLTLTVSRNAGLDKAITAKLVSSDTSEATVPASITFAAGETSKTVTVTAVDDSVADGSQSVNITASATGLQSASSRLTVTDNDTARLTISLAASSIIETGSTTATVSRNGDTSQALTVSLSSSDTGEATLPASVTIAAGQQRANVTVSGVDDKMADGRQTVTLTATASSYQAGTATLAVTEADSDNDGIPDVVEGTADTDGDGNNDSNDVDSDNDRIPDMVEAGSNPLAPVDSDGDSVPDYKDRDSDGDGILDRLETGEMPLFPRDSDGDGIRDYLDRDSDNDGLADDLEDNRSPALNGRDADSDGIDDNVDASQTGGTDSNNNGVDDTLEPADSDGDGLPNHLDLDSDNDGISDLVESGLAASQRATLDKDSNGRIDIATPRNTTAKLRSFGNDGILDSLQAADGAPVALTVANSDGDSVIDALDLDSDGDGIPDLVESGNAQALTLDANNNGQLSANEATVGADGIANALQADSKDGAALAAPVNSDAASEKGKVVYDYRDLDSDNDGLLDIVEAGGTDSDGNGLTDAADTNQDGLADSGFTYTPRNTDSASVADYRTPDSNGAAAGDDNDSNATLNALDVSPNDGVIDNTDDDDSDGLVNVVDAAPKKPGIIKDNDRDGVADSTDLDDDNDGIPDTVEGNGSVDTDKDGIADSLDLDSDNDGLSDLLEAVAKGVDSDNNRLIDSFTDANKDGLHDSANMNLVPLDTDKDGTPDYRDLDSDGDKKNDLEESLPAGVKIESLDADKNGVMDKVENGLPTTNLAYTDSDKDGTPDFRDKAEPAPAPTPAPAKPPAATPPAAKPAEQQKSGGGGAASPWLLLLLLVPLWLRRRVKPLQN